LKDIVPLAITMRERIDGMREWARTRARPASAEKSKAAPAGGKSWLARHGAAAPGGDAGGPSKGNPGSASSDTGDNGPSVSERKLEL
jgi:hypothetical protein